MINQIQVKDTEIPVITPDRNTMSINNLTWLIDYQPMRKPARRNNGLPVNVYNIYLLYMYWYKGTDVTGVSTITGPTVTPGKFRMKKKPLKKPLNIFLGYLILFNHIM